MPKNVYFWGTKERAQNSTERHQIFKAELYPHASLSGKEFKEKLEEFKEKNFDLLDSEKSGGMKDTIVNDVIQVQHSKLNNKLEG